jgi:hypothetical protein
MSERDGFEPGVPCWAVIVAPFDLPIGKSAVLADPQGATFSISRVVPA